MGNVSRTSEPPDMSNFDGAIHPDLADYLKAGGQGAKHYAWNFNGELSYENGEFVERVYRYHAHVATVRAATLEDLRCEVNDQFGWD